MQPVIASILPWSLSEDTHWILLIAQSVAFVAAVAIILRLAYEKRTPSNITAWSLLLLFMPLLGVPLYLLLGGRKLRRLVAQKNRMRWIADGGAAEGAAGNGYGKPISGNSVRVLSDGVKAYRSICKQIDRAQESIDIATFILGNDLVGRSIVRRLACRAREGVRVRLLVDALGSFGVRDSMLAQLRADGGQVERFIPLSFFVTKASANLRNHRKIAVFDGRRAIVGGQNMDRRFLSPNYTRDLFADLGLLIEGPAVTPLLRVFEGDWAFASKRDVPIAARRPVVPQPGYGHSDLEIIPSGPDVEGDPLWERIITLVQEARESITIVSPYFLPDEVLLRSLIIKAHAGRHVRVIVPENSNHPVVDLARNRFLRQMSAQGIEVLFYRKRMLHAKLIMVDGVYAVSGSANIDPRSFFVNFEIGLVHTSPGDLRAFEQWLETAIQPHCICFAASVKAHTNRIRLFGENMAHLFTPLL
jgi:cardiolipin synthase A/B